MRIHRILLSEVSWSANIKGTVVASTQAIDDVSSPQSSCPGVIQAMDDVSSPQSLCPGVTSLERFWGTC
eukprot:2767486-Prorocentrum_lima.AAC.1